MSNIDTINVGGVDFGINSSPIPAMAAIETGTTATRAYAVGDYVIVGIELYQVTAAIAIGDEFEEGVNISSPTSLANEIKENSDAINQLNNALDGSSSTTTNTYCGNFNLYKIGKLVICTGYVQSTQVFAWDAVLGIIPDGYKPTTYISTPLIFDNAYSGLILLAPDGKIISHNVVDNTIGQFVTIGAVWSIN